MTTPELRATIWDDLFRGQAPRTIDEIASQTAQDITAVQAAVDHDWFDVSDGRVSIAMKAPERIYRR